MKTSIQVDNLKCTGCAFTIEKALLENSNIEAVDINVETGEISITSENDDVEIEKLQNQLSKLGYPPVGTTNLVQKGKSYVSCMVGKIQKE